MLVIHGVHATETMVSFSERVSFSEVQNNSRRGSFRGETIGVLDMVR